MIARVIAVALALSIGSADIADADGGRVDAVSDPGPGRPPASAPTPSIRLRDGLLTVEATRVGWPEFVAQWRRATGVALRLLFQFEGPLTASFRDVPLERGLRLLVGPEPQLVVIYESVGSPAADVPVEAWVLAPGSGMAASARARPGSSASPDAALPGNPAEASDGGERGAGRRDPGPGPRRRDLRGVPSPQDPRGPGRGGPESVGRDAG